MWKNKIISSVVVFTVSFAGKAQILKLDAIIDSITASHPVVKMYNYEIRSMDEAAKGAKSWMPPEVSTGFWMVPYNTKLWKKDDMGATGMGQYMIGGQQMFPNKNKQNADLITTSWIFFLSLDLMITIERCVACKYYFNLKADISV